VADDGRSRQRDLRHSAFDIQHSAFMSLTRNDVEKVSLLARLSLTPAELDLLTTQLTAVVGYVEQLQALDTTNVEPMAHALPTANVFRDDTPRSANWSGSTSGTPEEAAAADRAKLLANAPHTDGEFYLVPAVLGE